MMSKPSYLSLGEAFYTSSSTAQFSRPRILLWNKNLASTFQLSNDAREQHLEIFSQSQNTYPSLAYSGHQFGHFNPTLGDGRAHLLSEVQDTEGERWELQAKGSGPTAFSRGGDGLCGLGPALREYIMSEALYALGVPTCRTLAVLGTGDVIYRQDGPTAGAIATRAARSHIRIGTFQYFASRGDLKNLKKLADYTIERHDLKNTQLDGTFTASEANGKRYVDLLDHFIDRQIKLVCEWMRVGFIHGVMNTDNVTLNGDTIDFGPCAMMERYDPNAVFSSIDQHGRYAFASQPDIAYWNTLRLAECLIPLVSEDHDDAVAQLGGIMTQFEKRFTKAHSLMLHQKFGLEKTTETSEQFIQSFMSTMHELQLDFTNTFTDLRGFLTNNTDTLAPKLQTMVNNAKLILGDFDAALSAKANPIIIPRNHLVETAIRDALDGSFDTVHRLIEASSEPYNERQVQSEYACPSPDGDQQYQTFCGT